MKTCTVCGIRKPDTEFYLKRKDTDVRRTDCKPCNRLRAKAWKERNLERSRAKAREWIENNRDRVRGHNQARLWRQVGRRRGVNPKCHPKWAINFFLREAYDLARLRTKVTGVKWEVDHIVPLRHPIVCGLHAHTNIRVVLAHANRVKSNAGWPGMPEPEITGFF